MLMIWGLSDPATAPSSQDAVLKCRPSIHIVRAVGKKDSRLRMLPSREYSSPAVSTIRMSDVLS
jgi:hypothetical protein